MRSAGSIWYGILVLTVLVVAIAGSLGFVMYPRFSLPLVDTVGLLLLAVGAGVTSFFSPCSFPLLATLLAHETASGTRKEPRSRPDLGKALLFATALSLGTTAFVLITGIVIALGGAALFRQVTFTSATGRGIRLILGLLLVFLGLIQTERLRFSFHHLSHDATRPLLTYVTGLRRRSPTAGFVVFGFVYLLAGFG